MPRRPSAISRRIVASRDVPVKGRAADNGGGPRITATAIEPRMNADDADTARARTTATTDEPRMNAETRGSLRGRAGSRHRGRKMLGAARESLACRGRKVRGGKDKPQAPSPAPRGLPSPPKNQQPFRLRCAEPRPGRDRSASSASIRGSPAVAFAVSASIRVGCVELIV